jgi:twitching motility protein PilT
MTQSFAIDTILDLIEKNPHISDLHLAAEEVISYRLNGEIVREEDAGIMSVEAMELVIRHLLQKDPQRFDNYLGQKDIDFAYVSHTGVPYRVNAYFRTGKMWVVMRKISKDPRQLEDIMFADIATSIKKNILSAKKWLYLVTGPTGSWKSTSIVSMLEHINQTRDENIVTIEDPIEYLFKPHKCLIAQREIGHDTRSYANALKASMRQDPDIIFVGEIRDRETAEAVLSLAETGHLVFSTLHTSSSSHTINRFIGFFPPEVQSSVADRLAEALIGVQSQFLVKSKDKASRVWLFEIMLNTTSIKNNIKKKEIAQLDNIIDTSSLIGMTSLKRYAQRLIDKNIIDPIDVEWLMVGDDD